MAGRPRGRSGPAPDRVADRSGVAVEGLARPGRGPGRPFAGERRRDRRRGRRQGREVHRDPVQGARTNGGGERGNHHGRRRQQLHRRDREPGMGGTVDRDDRTAEQAREAEARTARGSGEADPVDHAPGGHRRRAREKRDGAVGGRPEDEDAGRGDREDDRRTRSTPRGARAAPGMGAGRDPGAHDHALRHRKDAGRLRGLAKDRPRGPDRDPRPEHRTGAPAQAGVAGLGGTHRGAPRPPVGVLRPPCSRSGGQEGAGGDARRRGRDEDRGRRSDRRSRPRDRRGARRQRREGEPRDREVACEGGTPGPPRRLLYLPIGASGGAGAARDRQTRRSPDLRRGAPHGGDQEDRREEARREDPVVHDVPS